MFFWFDTWVATASILSCTDFTFLQLYLSQSRVSSKKNIACTLCHDKKEMRHYWCVVEFWRDELHSNCCSCQWRSCVQWAKDLRWWDHNFWTLKYIALTTCTINNPVMYPKSILCCCRTVVFVLMTSCFVLRVSCVFLQGPCWLSDFGSREQGPLHVWRFSCTWKWRPRNTWTIFTQHWRQATQRRVVMDHETTQSRNNALSAFNVGTKDKLPSWVQTQKTARKLTKLEQSTPAMQSGNLQTSLTWRVKCGS